MSVNVCGNDSKFALSVSLFSPVKAGSGSSQGRQSGEQCLCEIALERVRTQTESVANIPNIKAVKVDYFKI